MLVWSSKPNWLRNLYPDSGGFRACSESFFIEEDWAQKNLHHRLKVVI